MLSLNVHQKSDGVTIECRVTTRSSKNSIKGVRNGALCIALSAPPIEGRANDELISFISECTGRPRSYISIIRGEHGRNKVVFIRGTTKELLYSKLRMSA